MSLGRTIENEILGVKRMRALDQIPFHWVQNVSMSAQKDLDNSPNQLDPQHYLPIEQYGYRCFNISCAILFKQTWVVPPPMDQPLTSL